MAFAKELTGSGFPGNQAIAIGGGYGTLAATGSTIADAAPVTASMTVVSGADGTKGVILPLAQVGDECTLFNNSGSTLKVWPQSTAAISVAGTGLGTAAASFSQLTYKATQYKWFTPTQIIAITTA